MFIMVKTKIGFYSFWINEMSLVSVACLYCLKLIHGIYRVGSIYTQYVQYISVETNESVWNRLENLEYSQSKTFIQVIKTLSIKKI